MRRVCTQLKYDHIVTGNLLGGRDFGQINSHMLILPLYHPLSLPDNLLNRHQLNVMLMNIELARFMGLGLR